MCVNYFYDTTIHPARLDGEFGWIILLQRRTSAVTHTVFDISENFDEDTYNITFILRAC